MPERLLGQPVLPGVVVLTGRDKVRTTMRRTFPKTKGELLLVRSTRDLRGAFRERIVDAVIVDVARPEDDTWAAVALAREFPSVPFFALAPMRVADGPALARCAAEDFTDLLAEGMDDVVLRELVLPHAFTVRFAVALRGAHAVLGLTSPLQQAAWQSICAFGGRVVRTQTIADTLQVTREHLSRSFSAAGSPNLKRIIDLVRLIAAAELCKNPGYDVADVARVLRFASAGHLGTTAQRVAGTRSTSLARLRAADLIDRFRQGRARSRGTPTLPGGEPPTDPDTLE